MSHFSFIKTKLRNLDALKTSLSALGFDWKGGPVPVRGHRGQTHTANVAIAQENGYDIGFCWNGEEYEFVSDLQYWQQNGSVDRFLSQVRQQYALHTVLQETDKQGFQVAEREQSEDGSIRLVLQRWSG